MPGLRSSQVVYSHIRAYSMTESSALCSKHSVQLKPHLLRDGMAFPRLHAVSSWHTAVRTEDSLLAGLPSDSLAEHFLCLLLELFLPAGGFARVLEVLSAESWDAVCTKQSRHASPSVSAPCSNTLCFSMLQHACHLSFCQWKGRG